MKCHHSHLNIIMIVGNHRKCFEQKSARRNIFISAGKLSEKGPKTYAHRILSAHDFLPMNPPFGEPCLPQNCYYKTMLILKNKLSLEVELI